MVHLLSRHNRKKLSEKEELVVVLSFEHLNWNIHTNYGYNIEAQEDFCFPA